MPETATGAGLTVADVAARYRVSPDKVRAWIHAGELAAVNVATLSCGRPRFVVTVDALVAFEQKRSAAKPKPARRARKRPGVINFYPDKPAGQGVAS